LFECKPPVLSSFRSCYKYRNNDSKELEMGETLLIVVVQIPLLLDGFSAIAL
jgi:hypothetical protein